MKKDVGIFLFFGLMISTLSSAVNTKLTEIEQVALTFKELAYYLGASVPFYAALQDFNQNNPTSPAEISCKFCPRRSLPCGELIVKVQAKAMDQAIGAEDTVAGEVRKKMLATYYELTKLLCIGSVNDVKNFMIKTAQNETIPCEDCKRSEW